MISPNDRRAAEIRQFFDAEVEQVTTGGVTWRPTWDDLVVPAVSVNPTGIASAMTMITDTTGYLGCLEAANSGTPTACFQWQLSHMTDLRAGLKPHVHYLTLTTGDATWQASFKHIPLNGAATAWTTMVVGTDVLSADGAAERGALVSWALDDADYHFGISDLVLMTLQRVSTSTADTCTGSAVVLSADIHYRKVRFGSVNEASL